MACAISDQAAHSSGEVKRVCQNRLRKLTRGGGGKRNAAFLGPRRRLLNCLRVACHVEGVGNVQVIKRRLDFSAAELHLKSRVVVTRARLNRGLRLCQRLRRTRKRHVPAAVDHTERHSGFRRQEVLDLLNGQPSHRQHPAAGIRCTVIIRCGRTQDKRKGQRLLRSLVALLGVHSHRADDALGVPTEAHLVQIQAKLRQVLRRRNLRQQDRRHAHSRKRINRSHVRLIVQRLTNPLRHTRHHGSQGAGDGAGDQRGVSKQLLKALACRRCRRPHIKQRLLPRTALAREHNRRAGEGLNRGKSHGEKSFCF